MKPARPTCLAVLIALAAPCLAEEPTPARFADPPRSTRILKIIHNWPDRDADQDALIARLKGQGFGGVVSNVAFDGYLESEPKWAAFRRGVAQAREAGFTQWLYDEKGYPSANAGGLVLRGRPEWEASGLLIADARSEGPAVALASPPGDLYLAAAFPERDGLIDLAGRVDLSDVVREGRLKWTPPASPKAWRVLLVTRSRLFQGTHADNNVFSHIPYPNLLMAEPIERFVELTHQAYAARLGPELPRTFQATFTDEPSLMSYFLKPMPYRVLPWSPTFADEFQKRRGYDPTPIVPALVLDAGPEGARRRRDFWRTVAELVSENYFGRLQAWGRARGVPSGGHLLLEEPLASHVPNYGDMLACLRRMDAPGIDCLTSLPGQAPWFVARLAASAAELEGRELVMSETSDFVQRHRAEGDKRPRRIVTEAEIRGTINRLALGGVNCITSYYSFEGLDDDALRRLNAHVGRLGMMIRGGSQVADVAVVYPIESLWGRFEPSRHTTNDAPAAERIEALYRRTLDSLFEARRDPTIVDARALAEAKVEGDSLVHGRLRWRVVVLPGVDALPAAAWANLDRFAAAGGVVVTIGDRPRFDSSAQPDDAVVAAIAARLFGTEAAADSGPRTTSNASGGGGVFLPDGSAGLLPAAIDAVLAPDVAAAPRSPLRQTHRRIDAHDVYLIANDSDRPVADSISLPLPPGAAVESWDPATGEVRSITVAPQNAVPVALEPYGAVLVRVASVAPRARRPLVAGGLPTVRVSPLSLPEPTVGRGEFVRETVEKADGSWTFRGLVTRSNVDVHLFAAFRLPGPLDLSATEGLAVDAAVPPDQRTSTRMLVIVRTDDGGEYLASTSRSLAAPGADRTFVPWSSFEHAPWSKAGSSDLNPARVAGLSIGWGGYFGTEGETVSFRLNGVGSVTIGSGSGPPSTIR
ncbi:glycosyl hydrolase [Paludisphaera rhizosphaerae]|uniref:glycosyl hydrolase n=1 Tax=Paludisphaera rhizosphaerae TaxID=2711216 RepID=UPI0013EA2A10|nr:glycosyl hydrolase [Paludisphaera rhizosphaerae]